MRPWPRLVLLLALSSLPSCGSDQERAERSLVEAAHALMGENDPARALELYDLTLTHAEPGSDAWHRARWWRLHALAALRPDEVPAAIERLLAEDARRVKPLEVFDLATKMCLAGEAAGLAAFDAGMDGLQVDALERQGHRERLQQTLAMATGPR